MTGILYVGTSGFAYPGWAPAFYPQGTKGDSLLRYYAERLSACELNNTFYQQPSEEKIRSWLAATPGDFLFTVKAQRGGSIRGLTGDPTQTLSWLTAPYRLFGERLGSVLYRVPENIKRDDARLRALLEAWPRELALTVEFQDESWIVDETLDLLREYDAALCATELPEDDEAPRLFLTGSFLYLRLRRLEYEPAAIRAWAGRIAPFLEDDRDVFTFFRHDEAGLAPARALELRREVEALLAIGPTSGP